MVDINTSRVTYGSSYIFEGEAIIILRASVCGGRFDINYGDFNGSDAAQVKLLRALVSDIGDAGTRNRK